jgi:hypothetical protein
MSNKVFFKQVGGSHYKNIRYSHLDLSMRIRYCLLKVMQLNIFADIKTKVASKIY